MSDNFYRVSKGLTFNPQSQYGSGDPTGTDGDIYYNSVLNKFRKFQDGSWSDLSAGGGATSNLWVAQQVALSPSTTSFAVSFTTPMPDTSYIILGMMLNTVDTHPMYQQIEVTSKTTTGFNFTWNHPLDTSNYSISFIVPPKTFQVVEASIGLGVNTLASTLPMAQGSSAYGVIAQLQDLVDPNPQYQSVVVGSNTSNTVNFEWNVATDSVNYQMAYMIGATGQVAISGGATSVTVAMPVNFNTTNFGVVATIQNTVDTHPQFQPMIITAISGSSVTFSWNVATDTSNYLLNYYTISATT